MAGIHGSRQAKLFPFYRWSPSFSCPLVAAVGAAALGQVSGYWRSLYVAGGIPALSRMQPTCALSVRYVDQPVFMVPSYTHHLCLSSPHPKPVIPTATRVCGFQCQRTVIIGRWTVI